MVYWVAQQACTTSIPTWSTTCGNCIKDTQTTDRHSHDISKMKHILDAFILCLGWILNMNGPLSDIAVFIKGIQKGRWQTNSPQNYFLTFWCVSTKILTGGVERYKSHLRQFSHHFNFTYSGLLEIEFDWKTRLLRNTIIKWVVLFFYGKHGQKKMYKLTICASVVKWKISIS